MYYRPQAPYLQTWDPVRYATKSMALTSLLSRSALYRWSSMGVAIDRVLYAASYLQQDGK